jgi:hypothetical protein
MRTIRKKTNSRPPVYVSIKKNYVIGFIRLKETFNRTMFRLRRTGSEANSKAAGSVGGRVHHSPGSAVGFGLSWFGEIRRQRRAKTHGHTGPVVNHGPYEGIGKRQKRRLAACATGSPTICTGALNFTDLDALTSSPPSRRLSSRIAIPADRILSARHLAGENRCVEIRSAGH